MLNLPELVLKVRVDDSGAKQGLKGIENLGNSAGKSMAQVAKEQGKTVNQIRSDVMKLANEYKKQGMNMSDAMKQAYRDMGISASKSTSKLGGLFSNLGATIKTSLIGAGVAAAAAIGAAVVNIGKESLKAYADFEQFEGGVQKLFGKDAAKIVQKNAEQAFKTAGMSANEYMETVTGFSASLIQSLGGDTEKAAKVSDMAIRDMSDNANTFGTDMSLIQNAYQGFAKQNYSMLDNLKLGYGGTKSEMERLLADAEKITGKKYDLSNLNDVYEAIHVIQKEQHIAGTTAKEASKTIEGSFKSMKSSWTNLMTAFGTGDKGKIKKALKDFTKSVKTLAKNVIPVVGNIIKGMGTALVEGIKNINFTKAKDSFVKKLTDLMEKAGDKLPTLIPKMYEKLLNGIQSLLGKIQKYLEGKGGSGFGHAAGKMVAGLVKGFIKAIPVALKAVPKILLAILKLLFTYEKKMITTGVSLVKAFAKGLLDGAPAPIRKFVNKVVDLWNGLKTRVKGVIDKIVKNWLGAKFPSKHGNVTVKDLMTGVIRRLKVMWFKLQFLKKKAEIWVYDHFSKPIKKFIDWWDKLEKKDHTQTFHVNTWRTTLSRSLDPNVKTQALKNILGFKKGLDYVPYDNFPALLHKGERVLTKEEASAYRDYTKGHVSSVSGAKIDYVKLANAMTAVMPDTITVNTQVDGKTIASTTAPYMRTAINKIDTRKNRQLGLV